MSGNIGANPRFVCGTGSLRSKTLNVVITSNAVSLVTASNSCPADADQLCLTFSSVVDRARFEKLYKQIDLTEDDFSKHC